MREYEALNLISVFEKFRLVQKEKKLRSPYGIIHTIGGRLPQTNWYFSWEDDGLSHTETESGFPEMGRGCILLWFIHVMGLVLASGTEMIQCDPHSSRNFRACVSAMSPFLFPSGSLMAYHWLELFHPPWSLSEKKMQGTGLQQRNDQHYEIKR